MANRSCRRRPNASASPAAATAREPVSEPSVRRWPHPISQSCSTQADSMLQYILCTLSYQNELLCEIKTLLEQIATDLTDSSNET